MALSFRTFNDLNVLIANSLDRIGALKFDAIIGIPRSGSIPASLIATHMQRPVADLNYFLETGQACGRSGTFSNEPIRRILLVDDTVNKGRAMNRAVQLIKTKRPKVEIIRFAVWGPYQLDDPKSVVDVWLQDLKGPRVFQWNLWKHIRGPRWFYDMDGVLCRDPRKDENDDGSKYLEFIKTAEPLFLPTRPIGHIVTARLEKYRQPTVEWLKRHGVEFQSLSMMQHSTKAERMAAGNRGGWKALIVNAMDTGEFKKELFIESSPKQAGIIARETGLQVFCTSTQTVFRPDQTKEQP